MTLKKSIFLLAAASFALASCQTKPAEVTVATPGSQTAAAIDSVTAKRYVDNYSIHAGEVTDTLKNPTTGEKMLDKKSNTRCIWFSEKQLQDLLTKLHDEHGDGIRFYLATYDKKLGNKADADKDHKTFWGYNTLVMVSTKEKKISADSVQHWDYYKNTTANAPAAGFIVGASPENRGEICPPPRDCPKIGATLIQ